ncbi:MAG: SRPBCC family protein [Nannocystaceae bacterium]|nr:SRPBCC family protein [Nannocystaceae bacterium]
MSLTIQQSDSIVINAPAQRVWEINGLGFADIGSWARNVLQSRATTGDALPGAPASGRICTVAGFGEVVETLQRFDPETRGITLTIEKGLPFFVRRSEFRSQVIALDATRSRFEVSQTMEISTFPGGLLFPLLRRKISSAVLSILEDLKVYAESGVVHPDKARSQAA